MGMGDDGPSGWPGSDWIEDLLLQREGPEVYERWVRGQLPWDSEEVQGAWQAWGNLLTPGDKGLAKRALITDHRGPTDGNGLLFGKDACMLEHQGSFAPFFYSENSDKDVDFTDSAELLPGGPYRVKAHEVTGDFAALFSDSGRARNLLRELASESRQRDWADSAGVFSANNKVRPGDGGVEHEIADRLTSKDTARCLDASDVMLPAVRDAFYEAILLTLTRYSEGEGPGSIKGILENVDKVQEAQAKNSVIQSEVCSTPQQPPL
ncbi:hypothetical protein [Streptomyces flaveus]|nr:hypothetical protein [Streptomyces flaveus]